MTKAKIYGIIFCGNLIEVI